MMYQSFMYAVLFSSMYVGSTCASVSTAHSSTAGTVLHPHHEDSCKETGPETVSVPANTKFQLFFAYCLLYAS